MRVIFACDHAGFELKEHLKNVVKALNYEVEDMGAFKYSEEDDYPDFVAPAARAVSQDSEHTRAIVIGGSGQGEAIVANRFKNVRAVVYTGEPRSESEQNLLLLTREHNNANVLSLGARFLSKEASEHIVSAWLETPFSNEERHIRRIQKIESRTESQ